MSVEDAIVFVVAILICFVGRFLVYIINRKRYRKNKKLKKDLTAIEIKYLKRRFKIAPKRIDRCSYMLLFSFVDGLIVGIASICVIKVSDILFFQLLLGLIVVLSLIFIMYEIIGRLLVRKGE